MVDMTLEDLILLMVVVDSCVLLAYILAGVAIMKIIEWLTRDDFPIHSPGRFGRTWDEIDRDLKATPSATPSPSPSPELTTDETLDYLETI